MKRRVTMMDGWMLFLILARWSCWLLNIRMPEYSACTVFSAMLKDAVWTVEMFIDTKPWHRTKRTTRRHQPSDQGYQPLTIAILSSSVFSIIAAVWLPCPSTSAIFWPFVRPSFYPFSHRPHFVWRWQWFFVLRQRPSSPQPPWCFFLLGFMTFFNFHWIFNSVSFLFLSFISHDRFQFILNLYFDFFSLPILHLPWPLSILFEIFLSKAYALHPYLCRWDKLGFCPVIISHGVFQPCFFIGVLFMR